MFQFGVSALAVFSGSAYYTMRPMQNACFVAGTMVLTAAGLVAIERIKAGDRVISTNTETQESGEKAVLKTFSNVSNELVHVFVNDEEIVATPSHLFYDTYKGWTPAANLTSDSVLRLADASSVRVDKTFFDSIETPVEVFNFQVADWHTYHVGTLGLLVHNDCVDNKLNGIRRETEVEIELKKTYPESEGYQIKREALLRDSTGKKVIDPTSGTGRRIDFVVNGEGKIVDSIEVTSKTAPKDIQIAHESNVRANGGNYVRMGDGNLLELPDDLITRIIRRD
jgi:hypothetical protein